LTFRFGFRFMRLHGKGNSPRREEGSTPRAFS
jgi:hypothetical protein